jgi:hypothetical protein
LVYPNHSPCILRISVSPYLRISVSPYLRSSIVHRPSFIVHRSSSLVSPNFIPHGFQRFLGESPFHSIELWFNLTFYHKLTQSSSLISSNLSRFPNSSSIESAPILHFFTVLGNTRILDSMNFPRCITGTPDHYQSLKQLRNRLDSRKIAMTVSVRSVWSFPGRIRFKDDWTIIRFATIDAMLNHLEQSPPRDLDQALIQSCVFL